MNFVDPNIHKLIHLYKITLYKYEALPGDTDELLATPPFSRLKILYCGFNNNFTDKGLASLTHLTRLHCGDCEFTDVGLSYLKNLYTVINANNQFSIIQLHNLGFSEGIIFYNNEGQLYVAYGWTKHPKSKESYIYNIFVL